MSEPDRLADDDCSELENDVWDDINDRLIRAERQGFNLVAIAVREAVKATAARVRESVIHQRQGAKLMGETSKYRKKPVVIEAHQNLYASSGPRLAEWCGGNYDEASGAIFVPTLEGVMRAGVSDFIIKGVKGEFYPCKPDIFAATYEPVPS